MIVDGHILLHIGMMIFILLIVGIIIILDPLPDIDITTHLVVVTGITIQDMLSVQTATKIDNIKKSNEFIALFYINF